MLAELRRRRGMLSVAVMIVALLPLQVFPAARWASHVPRDRRGNSYPNAPMMASIISAVVATPPRSGVRASPRSSTVVTAVWMRSAASFSPR